VLVEFDPHGSNRSRSYDIPDGASAVRAGLGGVWIVYSYDQAVLHIDPRSVQIIAAIPTGGSPLFLDVGEHGVWVMNQGNGSVTHIDPSTDAVSATIAVDSNVDGGDLTVSEGSVWLRASGELVAQIDPTTDRVVSRYGKPEGSGSVSAGNGNVWITAHAVAHLYRVPVSPAPSWRRRRPAAPDVLMSSARSGAHRYPTRPARRLEGAVDTTSVQRHDGTQRHSTDLVMPRLEAVTS
jgi:YVTN family beta-propeller protein